MITSLKTVVYVEYLAGRSNNKLWLADVATGRNTLLTPKPETQQTVFDEPRFSAEDRGLYLVTNLAAEFGGQTSRQFAPGGLHGVLVPSVEAVRRQSKSIKN